MKALVIVRHGYYGGDFSLTSHGRRQAEALGDALAQRFNGSSIALLSSTAKRAMETSVILTERLGLLAFEVHKCLHSGGDCFVDGQEKEVIRLVKVIGEGRDVVILSTHMEYIDYFPTVWGREHGFDIETGDETPKGTARIVDVTTGKVEHFVPPGS